jgi:RecG-like helicase
LSPFTTPLKAIVAAYDDLPELQEGSVPCFSASASKDKPQDSYTEPGYALIKKSKTKRIANYNAQLIVVEQAISKLRDCFNQACEKEYEQQRYRQHLVALQLLRNEEEQERVARAVAAEELALENVAGRRERMERLETHIKRKKLGTDEGKKRTVFDYV